MAYDQTTKLNTSPLKHRKSIGAFAMLIWTATAIAAICQEPSSPSTPATSPASTPPGDQKMTDATFGADVAFLKQHTDVVVLSRGDSQLAIVPQYQGRVMTSTTGGAEGPSFGWLNYRVIAQGLLTADQRRGKLEDHIYVFGGEERFWLGPEGGQFGIYFAAAHRLNSTTGIRRHPLTRSRSG